MKTISAIFFTCCFALTAFGQQLTDSWHVARPGWRHEHRIKTFVERRRRLVDVVPGAVCARYDNRPKRSRTAQNIAEPRYGIGIGRTDRPHQHGIIDQECDPRLARVG